MSKTEEEVELINELMFLTEIADKVWKYHPKNPNKVDVVEEMETLKGEIHLVEMKLERYEK
jgi:hypothetical protein